MSEEGSALEEAEEEIFKNEDGDVRQSDLLASILHKDGTKNRLREMGTFDAELVRRMILSGELIVGHRGVDRCECCGRVIRDKK